MYFLYKSAVNLSSFAVHHRWLARDQLVKMILKVNFI